MNTFANNSLCSECLVLMKVFVILQLLGKVYRFPAPVCECSLETDRVKSSVSNCGVSGSAFQVHLQPGKDGFISNHHV